MPSQPVWLSQGDHILHSKEEEKKNVNSRYQNVKNQQHKKHIFSNVTALEETAISFKGFSSVFKTNFH